MEITKEMIQWAVKEGACADGIERAKLGWEHLVVYDRRWIAWRPSAPPELLEHLACDEDDAVRWVVAQNPSTPRESKRKLLMDKSRIVRGIVEDFFDIRRGL